MLVNTFGGSDYLPLWDALLSAHALTRKGDTVETIRALSLAVFAALVDASQNMISAGRTARTVTAMRRACIRGSRKAVSDVAGAHPPKSFYQFEKLISLP